MLRVGYVVNYYSNFVQRERIIISFFYKKIKKKGANIQKQRERMKKKKNHIHFFF